MIMDIRGAYAICLYTGNLILTGNKIQQIRIYQIFIPYGYGRIAYDPARTGFEIHTIIRNQIFDPYG